MTRFGPNIELITFPLLRKDALCYATEAGYVKDIKKTCLKMAVLMWLKVL